MITYDEVKEWFVYDGERGALIPMGKSKYKLTAYQLKGGYRFFVARGKTNYEHRLVWLYHYGGLPDRVDHKNRIKSDNHIENLREATPAENNYNVGKRSHNTTGAKGVVRHKACKSRPYQAKIVIAGKVKSLGYYATVDEASAAYQREVHLVAKEFAAY